MDVSDYKNAIKLLEKTIKINEKNVGQHHPKTARNYFNLAQVYLAENDRKTAIDLLKKSHKIFYNVFGDEHPRTREVKSLLDKNKSFQFNENRNKQSIKIPAKSVSESIETVAEPMFGTVVSVAKSFHQLGILVLDGSGSMKEKAAGDSPKHQEVNAGVMELFTRLNASRVKQNFSFSCIKFDTSPTQTLSPTPFDYDKLMKENFDPIVGKGGGTNIFEALNEAKTISDNFLTNPAAESVPHKVLILLMSDGMCFNPETTKAIAKTLKSNPNISIACAYFGMIGNNDTNAQNLLKNISSDSILYYNTVYDGDTLRAFFERSISASCGVKI